MLNLQSHPLRVQGLGFEVPLLMGFWVPRAINKDYLDP